MNGVAKQAFWRGARDFSPLILGVIPFGTVAGIAAIEAGLNVGHAMGFSIIVLAGASQLASIALIGQSATIAVIVATALIINARFLMYSASLAPHLAGLSVGKRALVAYLLTDQAYAFSIIRYREENLALGVRLAYYLGVGVTLWSVWQASTLLGAVVGSGVPDEWSLDFAIPLVFLALLVPAIRDRADGVAAAVAGGLAVMAAALPYNLALPLAAMAGISVGVVVERKLDRD